MELETSTVCPVCSLYLREGISLKSHLQTHSKDKVIEALLKKQIASDDVTCSETDTLTSMIRDSSSISLSSENRVTSYSHSTLSIIPTPTFVHAANQSPPSLNCNQNISSGIQYMPPLSNNVLATQTVVGNSCQSNVTYQQFLTNDGNVVLIPMYAPQPPVVVSNNLLSPPVINSCIVVPTSANNVGSVTVVDPAVPHETPRLTSSPQCVALMANCTDDVDDNASCSREGSESQPLVVDVDKSSADDYEKENDAEVANIFQIPYNSDLQRATADGAAQSTTHSVVVDVDTDDKSSCRSYDNIEEEEENQSNYSAIDSPYLPHDYENDLEPSKSSSSSDVSVVKLQDELHYESENSDYTAEAEADDSATDVLKSDDGESDKFEHSYGKSSKSSVPIIDNKTYTSPIHSPAPMENSVRTGQFDFIVSNSDNATHILPDRLDESGASTSKHYERDHYILPNNEIPTASAINTDYSFIGLRSSFSTSASLISSVNKTMFADVDVYAIERNDQNSPEKFDNDNATNLTKGNFYGSQRRQARYTKMNTTTEEKIRENYKGINELLLDSAGSSRVSPFDIQTDESMPARGELSGQESLSGTENSIWELQVKQKSFVERCKANTDMKIGLQSLMTEINIKMDADTFRNVECEPLEEDSKLSVHNIFKKKLLREFRCFYCKQNFDTWKSRQSHIGEVHAEEDGLTIESLFGKKVVCKREEEGDGAVATVTKQEGEAAVATVTKEEGQDDGAIELTAESIICRICSENFENGTLFLKHLRFVHGIKKRNCVCPTCLVHFASVEEYQEHIQKVHPYECMTCGKKFHTRPGYMLHQKRHMKVKPYGCEVCDKSFVTKQKLSEHINVHTGDNPIKCDMCDAVFKRYSNYQQHKKYLHMNTKRKLKDFICDCGEVFHSKTKLLWHREIHDSKPKQCPFCVERFVHTASLTRHVRKWHNESYLSELVDKKKIKNVVCPVCNVTYLHSSLQTHMKIHEGIKPFSCGECSKTFRTKWNLQLHRWTHMSRSSKPYKCKLCVKAYIHKTDYDAHLRSHSNCRPYSCNVCGRQFIRKYNCIRHMREHKESKPYQCNVCKKMFSRSYYLTEHHKTHTGEKPHTCHVCGKTSATKSNHNKHVKMHNNIRESVNSEG